MQELGYTRKIALRLPHFSVLPDVQGDVAELGCLLSLSQVATNQPMRSGPIKRKIYRGPTAHAALLLEHTMEVQSRRWLLSLAYAPFTCAPA